MRWPAAQALKLLTPTRRPSNCLRASPTSTRCWRWARAPRTVPLTMPRIGHGSEGPRPVMPDEPAYAELGRLDPEGHGQARYEIVPGRAGAAVASA